MGVVAKVLVGGALVAGARFLGLGGRGAVLE